MKGESHPAFWQFQKKYVGENFWVFFSPNFEFIIEKFFYFLKIFLFIFFFTYGCYTSITQPEVFKGEIQRRRVICGLRNEVKE